MAKHREMYPELTILDRDFEIREAHGYCQAIKAVYFQMWVNIGHNQHLGLKAKHRKG